MKEKHVHILSIALTAFGGVFVVWLYAVAPKTLADVPRKAQATIETVATKTQVAVGAYEVDRAKFDDGLRAFRQNDFARARDWFVLADVERRDAKTQFYIAYSFYREGFGKVYNDNELFKKGLVQADSVIALDRNFKSDDADLKLKTPFELRNEFEEGLKVSPDDFNPFKVLRERK